ncbi:epimerase family protein SDR39U1 isoform X1 [Plodia interpunctella]|uniref:epimerase family protein SDR39U1 isoform X1 n=2 Tax=Plodia interpunctella TaxID=58824 RepID=UPI002368CD44|nr:epimerase family protein SDR39U1 isoform X1 [Plodia interpunctella]XP_053606915.1 epimerase family protein SDR39U1 isoform X1 [Plodia interpunctella]
MAACRKIVIGGGTGFIGRNLGELLLANGYNFINVTRMPGANNISWSQLEVTGLPKKTYAVVNCAGQQFMDFTKTWTPGFKQNVQNSRVFTTRALAKAINLSQDKPKVYVLVTGVGAYEPSDCNQYDESSPTTGIDFFSRLVVEWEKAANVDPPVRLVIIRSGAVLGRWGGMIKNMFLPFFLGVGGRIGTGKQYLPWIHIKDLTRLIIFAIENDNVSGVLNGVAPQVITNEEFTQSFAKALRRPAVIPVPEAMLDYLLHPERAMIMTKGQHVTPKRVIEYGFKYHYEDIDSACQEVAHLLPKKHPLN